jgi:hypothetical protein
MKKAANWFPTTANKDAMSARVLMKLMKITSFEQARAKPLKLNDADFYYAEPVRLFFVCRSFCLPALTRTKQTFARIRTRHDAAQVQRRPHARVVQ